MAYLTVEEYVARFGARETTLFTNTDLPQAGGAATYDPAKVEAQISDATDEVEGYISRRYAVPLASPPSIVKGWVAALARLKLAEGTTRVPEAIKDAADRATRQLEQLAASKLDLPVAEGAAPVPENAVGSPMSSNDRDAPTFTTQTLAGYTDTFTGGSYAPCWRQGR